LDRLEKLSGKRKEKTAMWLQKYERGTGDLIERYDPVFAKERLVRVTEKDQSRLDANALLALGSRRQSSLIRFTFGSGYTQFAGASVPVVSQYSISYDEYLRRRSLPWPTAEGAFEIAPPSVSRPTDDARSAIAPDSFEASIAEDDTEFASEFERRGRQKSPKSVDS
jgi:hypothetical protein